MLPSSGGSASAAQHHGKFFAWSRSFSFLCCLPDRFLFFSFLGVTCIFVFLLLFGFGVSSFLLRFWVELSVKNGTAAPTFLLCLPHTPQRSFQFTSIFLFYYSFFSPLVMRNQQALLAAYSEGNDKEPRQVFKKAVAITTARRRS
jgi:hypothetical protein